MPGTKVSLQTGESQHLHRQLEKEDIVKYELLPFYVRIFELDDSEWA
jgi:hypothetical protein